MPKHLERDLGLYATITVSIGAMIGSGLFVLPGLAAAKTGPSIIFAYVLAGFIVLPAALSKAEMATAMPESGGTYLYIDRAMGPLMGTVAGLGAWFSLVFKSAFALVGLGAYLVLVLPLPAAGLKGVSLGIGVLLVLVNLLGVKQSGRLQAAIVTVVLLTLVGFGANGITFVQAEQYHPFFTHGAGGLLAATGFVFVSYAGVTKIASVAEEVERPDRNLPLGMLLSVGIMIPVYAVIAYVIVGVTPADTLRESLTPMADAGMELFGSTGHLVIAGLAILALTSMANAGVLSSSRFPLAMSRDRLAPEGLSAISDRFRTPSQSIWLTGGLLLVLIAFVPVVELAKLASAFKILIFTFINGALIAFRESGLESYKPAFRSPGYPWVQFGGIIGGLVLLTQMGWVPTLGAAGIIAMGILWYHLYGRERTGREGAAIDVIRTAIRDRALVRVEDTFAIDEGNVLVAMSEGETPDSEHALLELGASVARRWGGALLAVRFETVPEQVSLPRAADHVTSADRRFEERVQRWADEAGVPSEIHEIVCHDRRRAAKNFAAERSVRLFLGTVEPGRWRFNMHGTDIDVYMRQLPCEVAFLYPRANWPMETIVVMTQRSPYGPLKVLLADAVAQSQGAALRFVTAVSERATAEELEGVRHFHRNLEALCEAPATGYIVQAEDAAEELRAAAADADFAVLGARPRSRLRTLLTGDLTDELTRTLDCPVLLVRPQIPRGQRLLRAVVERLAF